MENNKKEIWIIGIVAFIFSIFIFITSIVSLFKSGQIWIKSPQQLTILSSYENKDLENDIQKYAKKEQIKLKFQYMGDLEIIDELDQNSNQYDAVWLSNSMWSYMLKNPSLINNSKSISISPVVFGIKKTKAKELGLINTKVSNNDLLNLIRDKKIKYVMSSVTQTNTGATAYFGFLNALAGNPEILTEEIIRDETLLTDLTSIFSGVERVSKEEDYLEEMFLNNDQYEAVIASESSLININKTLTENGKEPLYLLFPTDGVAINDSTFGLINKNKNEEFTKIQQYLLSKESQKKLENKGRRTWYGGTTNKADQKIFNKEWGIDTENYLNVTKFPSKKIMTLALNLYIEKVRKPTHVVFCLDYSGSMHGEGITELKNAMNYILDYEQAKEDNLQFSEKDKITIIPFSTQVIDTWTTENGYQTEQLQKNISTLQVGGTTALYDAIQKGIEILNQESNDYTKTIIALTDGDINVGRFIKLSTTYQNTKTNIPVYSITFGEAIEEQLEQIAKLTNARVFDGKTNLLSAFKEVRGYN